MAGNIFFVSKSCDYFLCILSLPFSPLSLPFFFFKVSTPLLFSFLLQTVTKWSSLSPNREVRVDSKGCQPHPKVHRVNGSRPLELFISAAVFSTCPPKSWSNLLKALNLESVSQSPKNLLKTQITGLHCGVRASLGWGLRICVSGRFSCGSDAAGPETKQRSPVLWGTGLNGGREGTSVNSCSISIFIAIRLFL